MTSLSRLLPPSPARVLMTALVLLSAVLLVLELIPANYYMLLPGDALPVQSMITVKGYPVPHVKGQLYMTDVTLYKVDHLLEELYGRIDPNAELDPAQSFSGGLNTTQYFQLNTELMDESIRDAEAAALHVAIGYKVRFATSGPEIIFVMPGTPAGALLKVNDVIVSIDGHRVRTADDVPPLVRLHKPGQIVVLGIQRGTKRLTVRVRTIHSTNGTPDKNGPTPLIGVMVQNRLDLPVKIGIDAGSIGGPSAGTMFALGIIERIERKDLTHGCKVAGTGTISYDGTVGPIGGARQKVVAARRAGARYFLVPDVPDNVAGARAGAGGLTVVPIKTLQDAVNFLNHLKPCG